MKIYFYLLLDGVSFLFLFIPLFCLVSTNFSVWLIWKSQRAERREIEIEKKSRENIPIIHSYTAHIHTPHIPFNKHV